MGCNQSKDDNLAADFFGNDGSAKGSQADDVNLKETVRTANVTTQQKTQPTPSGGRKNDFVAPPSSESFIAAAPPEPRKVFSPPPTINEAPAPTSIPAPPAPDPEPGPAPPPTLTPVPPSSAKGLGASNRQMNAAGSKPQASPRQLNDDDFSVAPSLDVAMRSIVAQKFGDIYKKGKKVSRFWENKKKNNSVQEKGAKLNIFLVFFLNVAGLWCFCQCVYWQTPPYRSRVCCQAS